MRSSRTQFWSEGPASLVPGFAVVLRDPRVLPVAAPSVLARFVGGGESSAAASSGSVALRALLPFVALGFERPVRVISQLTG